MDEVLAQVGEFHVVVGVQDQMKSLLLVAYEKGYTAALEYVQRQEDIGSY